MVELTTSITDAPASPSYVYRPFPRQDYEFTPNEWHCAYVTITRRKQNESLFDFQITAPSRRPRPWERAPKSPFATRRRGRKVWKRYGLRSTESTSEAPAEVSDTAKVESLNTARPVKRLRTKQAPIAAEEGGKQNPGTSYVATLHETAFGTPKSRFYFLRLYSKCSGVADTVRLGKYSKRKSLRPDRLRPIKPRKSGILHNPDTIPELPPAGVCVVEAPTQVEEPPLLASPDLSKTEHPGEDTAERYLSSPVDGKCTEIETEIISDIPAVNTDDNVTYTVSLAPSDGDFYTGPMLLPEASTENHQAASIENGDGVIITSSLIGEFVGVVPAGPIEAHDRNVDTPSPGSKKLVGSREGSMDSPRAFRVTLPDNQHTAVIPIITSSPVETASNESQPSDIIGGVQALEETSEKPILANSGDTSVDQTILNHRDSLEDVATFDRQQTPINRLSTAKVYHRKSSAEQVIIGSLEASQQIKSVANEEILPVDSFKIESMAFGGDSSAAGDDSLHEPSRRASGLLAEICDLSPCDGPSENEDVELRSDVSTQLARDDRTPDVNADDAEINEAEMEENSKTTHTQTEVSGRRTRSATRFSDETKMLKDFVNRVQAKKAAKDIRIPVYVAAPMASPRRSPRKALAEVDKNSPSPQKPHDLVNRPGTPPGDRKLGSIDDDDLDDIAAEQKKCRRSTRTRVFAPSTNAAGAPSFIPVRRADGEAIVPLQTSRAQELATITRANTKRNKGQSKPAKVTLQTLPADALEDAIERPGGHGEARAVGWDETLVYYQEGSEWKEGQAEKRPKVGRMRKVGATNGTPARKKLVSETESANGESAARGRSKAKSKGQGRGKE